MTTWFHNLENIIPMHVIYKTELVRVGISVNNFGKTMKVSWAPVTWLQPANNEFLKFKIADPSQKPWFINITIPDLHSNIIPQRKQKLFIVHDE